VHGTHGLGGVALSPGPPPQPRHAVDALAQALHDEPPGTLTLVAVGPLTNLALLETMHPGALRRAQRLLVMGGAVSVPGNVTPHAEFNFHSDPIAAHIVLGAGAPVELFGLDVTTQAIMSPDWIVSLREVGTRCAQAVHAMLSGDAKRELLLHDACPVACLLEPDLFDGADHPLGVDWAPGPTEGRVHVQDGGGTSRVVTRVDAARLLDLVRERFGRLP